MNKTETAQVLTIASGFDRRQVDAVNVEAWHTVVGSYLYDETKDAVIAHFRDPNTRKDYLTVGHVLDRLEALHRGRRADVEADVRAAKARSLIERSYPPREPLPVDVAILLARARQRDLESEQQHERAALALDPSPERHKEAHQHD